jgi:hypothetical protein
MDLFMADLVYVCVTAGSLSTLHLAKCPQRLNSLSKVTPHLYQGNLWGDDVSSYFLFPACLARPLLAEEGGLEHDLVV